MTVRSSLCVWKLNGAEKHLEYGQKVERTEASCPKSNEGRCPSAQRDEGDVLVYTEMKGMCQYREMKVIS